MINRAFHIFVLIVFFLGGAGLSRAETIKSRPVAVVELFTSQGCSSCPPADQLLGELGEREDVLALAYHVDYWDYIGWKDTFGRGAFSDLQRAYARNRGKSRIYTPQLIVNGEMDYVGSHRADIELGLSTADLSVNVDLQYREGLLDVRIGAVPGHGEASIYVVTFKRHAHVDINRGENRGKSIDYRQVVTSRQILGMWDPVNGTHLKLPVSELLRKDSDGVAVLVQQRTHGLPGPILGAAMFEM